MTLRIFGNLQGLQSSPMPEIKLVTINILNDLSRWEQRRGLLACGLAELQPDLVALQEVRLPQNPARWLAEQMGLEYIYLSPKSGPEASLEGLAILSRLPFENQESLPLGGQHRIAQRVQIRVNGLPLALCNGHYFWQPGESAERLRQAERVSKWMADMAGNPHRIVCGDFNGTPETSAVQYLRQHYTSAYAAIHGQEPEYTCPTPLPRSRLASIRTFLGFFLLLRPGHIDSKWRGTLDYIFVDHRLKVLDCRVVLDQPAQENPNIYPSDHFGLYARLEIGN